MLRIFRLQHLQQNSCRSCRHPFLTSLSCPRFPHTVAGFIFFSVAGEMDLISQCTSYWLNDLSLRCSHVVSANVLNLQLTWVRHTGFGNHTIVYIAEYLVRPCGIFNLTFVPRSSLHVASRSGVKARSFETYLRFWCRWRISSFKFKRSRLISYQVQHCC